MDQETLNKTRIDEWDEQGLYQECFRSKLTSKHELVVGKWTDGDEWGVDLRRWSYDLARLLGEGITLSSSTWEWLIQRITAQYNDGLFENPETYGREINKLKAKIDNKFSIGTEYFYSDNGHSYLCINIFNKNNKQIWKGPNTRLGIMIRFDTIRNFLILSRESGLIKSSSITNKPIPQKDTRTGKVVF